MLTKKGEVQGAVQIGNGIEGQGAFALSDHLGVIVNYNYISSSGVYNDSDYHRHRLLEAGVGYFSNREESFFEVYAGYGRGKGSSFDSFDFFDAQVAATGNYERYFIQPAFGLNKDELNIAFAPRISMVDFYRFSDEVMSVPIVEKPKFLFEPAVIGRVNFANNHMFATFQAGMSLGMSQGIYFQRRTFQTSAGLGFRFGAARKLVSRL